jgi:hypothetical protein
MDSVQIVLLIVIIALTILLIVLGIQVYFILKDLRTTIVKANKVLDNAGDITSNVAGPIANLSIFASTIKTGSVITVAKIIRGLLSRDDDAKRHR